MSKTISLCPQNLQVLRRVDDRMMSYNIEMTEVTGGTFWKEYTPAQIAGTEAYPPFRDLSRMADLMQVYPPIDLYNPKLRALGKALGPVWVRVSGGWATRTYYDFDGHTKGVVPEGYQSILTKDQWIGVLEFIKAVDGKLLISVANCDGLHKAQEPWNPSQAKLLFDFSRDYGVPISAAEFMNEPNMLATGGGPTGYTPADYARDQDLFYTWVKENYPGVLLVGPCSTGDVDSEETKNGGGLGAIMECCSTRELMAGTKVPPDVYSYHYYNGISERMAAIMPERYWGADRALTEEYLNVAPNCARVSAKRRDQYCPHGQMWVTESGDAGGGGCTWASTYLDVFRTLNELGSYGMITDGVIFHNTLASSDYGFLSHSDFTPRPNYYAVLLWTRLMGDVVYDPAIPGEEGVHVYARSRKDGQDGVVYLLVNNSATQPTLVELPAPAQRYTLSADGLRATTMQLNGRPLVLGPGDGLPDLSAADQPAGTLELAPATCTFLVL